MTARFAWASLITLGVILVEVWCARLGLLVAGWPLLALYLGVSIGIHWGVWFGLSACMATEIMLGRNGTSAPLIVLLLPLIQFWRRHGDRRYLLVQMLPAGAAGLSYCLWTIVLEDRHGGVPEIDFRWAAILVGAGAATSCLGGPIAWRLLDLFALLFGIPRFHYSAGMSGPSDDQETDA